MADEVHAQNLKLCVIQLLAWGQMGKGNVKPGLHDPYQHLNRSPQGFPPFKALAVLVEEKRSVVS